MAPMDRKPILKMRIRELRKLRGWSQTQLALSINVSTNAISRYERGDIIPSTSMLIKLADEFDVSIDYLIGRNKE